MRRRLGPVTRTLQRDQCLIHRQRHTCRISSLQQNGRGGILWNQTSSIPLRNSILTPLGKTCRSDWQTEGRKKHYSGISTETKISGEVKGIIQSYVKAIGGDDFIASQLERSFQEQESVSAGSNLIHFIVSSWRDEFLLNEGRRDNSNLLLPSSMLNYVRDWQSTSTFRANTTTYEFIIEVAGSLSNNHVEGVFFAESVLEWMSEEAKESDMVKPNIICFAHLMNAWIASGRKEAPEKIEALVKKLSSLHDDGWLDLKPNVVIYNIWLNSLAKSSNVEKAEEVLQSMLTGRVGVFPDHISYTTLLSAYMKQPDVTSLKSANTLLRQMHELYEAGMESAKPNAVSYTILMEAYAKLGQPEQAQNLLRKLEDLFEETSDPDWRPDGTAYNAVIQAWSKADMPDRAHQCLQDMHSRGLAKPTERSFNTVLSGWAKRGATDQAEAILLRMHELHTQEEGGDNENLHGDGVYREHLDVKPSVITYNAVLDSWSKSGHPDAVNRSLEILNHMDRLVEAGDIKVRPNTITWNTALNCAARSGNLKVTETIMKSFIAASDDGRADGRPNTRTWNTMLSAALKQKNYSKAKSYWKAMKKSNIQPDIISYNTLLNCLANSFSKSDVGAEVQSISSELKRDSRVRANRITYLALVNAWIKAGRPEKGEDLLITMADQPKATQPDRRLFHKVLAGWAAKGKPKRAASLVGTMERLHLSRGLDVKPNTETYNILLNGWAKSMSLDAGERAESILRQMESSNEKKENLKPDLITYNTVLNAWANSGDPTCLTRIEHLVLEMILKGNPRVTPTDVSYSTWLKAIERSNDEEKGRRAKDILKMMKINKLEPSPKIAQKIDELIKV